MKKIVSAALVVAIALIGFMVWTSYNGGQTGLPTVSIGTPFKLASSSGGVLDSATLKGKPYGMFFGFTHCPEVCPTTMSDMTETLKALGDDAKDFKLYFVTVDPERDTAADLKDYISNFDPRIEALVPTPAELPALAKAFRIYYEKVPTSDGSYTMNHTATVLLFNRDGDLFGTLAYDEKPEIRLQKLKRLISG